MKRSATFSPCREYRYALWRQWGGMFSSKYAMFIGLNPSKADEITDDPTVRRFIGYARDWGYAGCCVGNEFGFRATLPKDMKAAEDPIGPDNDRALIDMAKGAGIIIAAWGNHGNYMGRDEKIRTMIPRLHYLRLTKGGFPSHLLYLPRELKPTPWDD